MEVIFLTIILCLIGGAAWIVLVALIEYYFSGKEELFDKVLDDVFGEKDEEK